MIISNSDISSFQRCEFRWFYERKLNLRPHQYPEPMEVGTFGHTMMEAGFEVVLAGGSEEEAIAAVTKVLNELIMSNDTLALPKSKVYRNVVAFISYYFQQPWRVLAIEEKGNHPVADGLEFGFTPDLILEWTEGPKRGRSFILDYKFTGQVWNDREINMFQQIPKYMVYKNRRDGTNIKMGAVVLVNTRATATDRADRLFFIKWLPITQTKLDNIARENEVLMHRILPYFQASVEEARSMVTHTVNKDQCKLCPFGDDVCPAEFEGRDASKMIERNYVQNDYGYN